MKKTIIGAGVAAAVLVTVMGSPAGAATAPPRIEGPDVQTNFVYTLVGRTAGAPGNAHSGAVGMQYRDGDVAQLHDWRCPAGVTPPAAYRADVETPCRILRSVYVYEANPTTRTLDWRLSRMHAVTTHLEVYDNVTGVDRLQTIESDYTMHGSGPVSSQRYDGGPVADDLIRTRASNRVTGHFGWVRFDDPRMRISSGSIEGAWTIYKTS